ncbi:substrate-binding domain-containing protein [Gloeobacter morelensis]|uniref:Substrate-binding domain-containing protein n=1 Tax=Gloeobacter morelensis MG652769 TaxID=2781736 RepID=A0ABY3PQ67_9CYAN|nr:substrate-binding domain-containing protein [Gloeobacter morelensis]UFP95688.1 substrate-binding domain-containing protein [Gloeobacter morelensis MG652769]
MVRDLTYVTCPKCGHDRNPNTATNCEICGQRLKGGGIPPIAWIALAVLLLGGAGYYFWQNRPGEAPVPVASTSTPPASTVPAQPATTPGLEQVKSPFVKLFATMAEVENVPSGLFNYGGSTTFAPLRSRTVLGAIAQAHPEFKLRYAEPVSGKPGSGTGIAMLIAGEMSFAQSSRAVKAKEYAAAKERGFALEQVPVAIDGLAFFVHPNNPVAGLSVDQIVGLFTGKITNWKQVGGPDRPVVPFSRNLQAGGTVDYFNEEVLGGAGLGKVVRETRDTTDALRKVAATPGGIGYATASEVIGQRSVRPVPLARSNSRDYVAPFGEDGQVNRNTFRDGTYPVTRRLFVVIRRDGRLDEQAGAAYANLLLSGEGQQLVEKSGFVAIR